MKSTAVTWSHMTVLAATLVTSMNAAAIVTGFESPDLSGRGMTENLIDILDSKTIVDVALSDIVRQLQSGDRAAGKAQLAEYVRTHPDDPDSLELAGLLLIQEGKYEQAAISLRRVLTIDPGRHQAGGLLGLANLMRGKRDLAETQFKQTLSIDQNNPLALRYLAWIERRRADYGGAVAYLERLMRTQGAQPLNAVHLELADLYIRQSRFRSAATFLRGQGVEQGSLDGLAARAGLMLAMCYVELGATEEAGALLTRLEKKLPPDTPDLAIVKAGHLRLAGDLDQSAKLLEALIEKHPEFARPARHSLSKTLAQAGDIDGAVAQMTMLIEGLSGSELVNVLREITAILTVNKRFDAAHKLLGQQMTLNPYEPMIAYLDVEVLILEGKRKAALNKLDRTINRYPKFLPAYLLAGRLATQEVGLRAGEGYLRKGTQVAPDAESAWIELANLYTAVDALDRTRAVLTEGVARLPKSPTLNFELGSVAEEMGDIGAANRHYRAALAANMFHRAAFHNLMANLAMQPEKHPEALRIGRYLHDQRPSDPVIMDAYGWVLLKAGKTEEARVMLSNALRTMEADAASYDKYTRSLAFYHLGTVYREAGEADKARQLYESALKIGAHGDSEQDMRAFLAGS